MNKYSFYIYDLEFNEYKQQKFKKIIKNTKIKIKLLNL